MDNYAVLVMQKRRDKTESGIVNQILAVKENYNFIYNTCFINTEAL